MTLVASKERSHLCVNAEKHVRSQDDLFSLCNLLTLPFARPTSKSPTTIVVIQQDKELIDVHTKLVN